jgi:hypothetical protein
MKDDDPITLKTAAADFGVPIGVLKANGIAGKLEIYKLGTRYYTTPNAVRNWVQSCRVEPKAPGFTVPSERERLLLLMRIAEQLDMLGSKTR